MSRMLSFHMNSKGTIHQNYVVYSRIMFFNVTYVISTYQFVFLSQFYTIYFYGSRGDVVFH